VLYCSLLEAVGVETAFVTVPGHIYAAFNTKLPAKSYNLVHPDKNMSLNINGELWVPVEITMIGTHDFHTAWRTGIEEFAALADQPEQRGFHLTAKSQEIYRPVGLQEEDLGLQYGNAKSIVEGFRSSIDKLTDQIIESFNKTAQEAGSKDAYNRLGIMCAKYARYPQAQRAFNTALSLDRNFVSAQINLGNVHYLKEEYQDALRIYHNAEETLRVAGQGSSSLYTGVLLNISRAYYQLENYEKAAEYFQRLVELDSSAVEQHSYLATRQPGGRSGVAPSRFSIHFAGEEE
jgi:tetratricopeptide (TPR) repeat protein